MREGNRPCFSSMLQLNTGGQPWRRFPGSSWRICPMATIVAFPSRASHVVRSSRLSAWRLVPGNIEVFLLNYRHFLLISIQYSEYPWLVAACLVRCSDHLAPLEGRVGGVLTDSWEAPQLTVWLSDKLFRGGMQAPNEAVPRGSLHGGLHGRTTRSIHSYHLPSADVQFWYLHLLQWILLDHRLAMGITLPGARPSYASNRDSRRL